MLPLYAGTLLLSAALLFCVEPMVAKTLLPVLGGAPAVWVTCMVFFQAALLAGYGYAHASSAWLGPKKQAPLHLGLLVVAGLVLPVDVAPNGMGAATGRSPVLELFRLLVAGVGLPFFLVSSTAPMLQRWFSTSGHSSRNDPYFLYGASNVGSLLALAAYPAVVEPMLGLRAQSRAWAWGYAVLVVAIAACSAALRSRPPEPSPPEALGAPPAALTLRRRLLWVSYAFVPSSLFLGVTTYVTTDIAAIPLFWVAPLAVYLLTFALVFARHPPLSHECVTRIMPLFATIAILSVLLGQVRPTSILLPAHLATLLFASLVCHGELARDRPPPSQLTEFFLWVSIGGVLGGVFNAIVAPAIFDRIAEYPLAIVLACACRRGPGPRVDTRRDVVVDAAKPALLGVATAVLLLVAKGRVTSEGSLLEGNGYIGIFGAALAVNYGSLARPRRFAVGILAVLLAGGLYAGPLGETVHAERNFFGEVRVTHDAAGRFVQIANGDVIHGRQSLDPARRGIPLAYFHPTGPLGQIFEAFDARKESERGRVGIIGLGAGTMAAYARPRETWSFYEINPAVVLIAEDPAYFTYLSDHFPGGRGLSILVGDARLRLGEAPDHTFDLLVLDAFSSDAIPVHLLTREAIALYLAKLEGDGILAAHVSNVYLDLTRVVARLALDAGLVAYGRADLEVTPEEAAAGKSASTWVTLARSVEALGPVPGDPRWHELHGDGDRMRVWTDDYSNLLSVYRW